MTRFQNVFEFVSSKQIYLVINNIFNIVYRHIVFQLIIDNLKTEKQSTVLSNDPNIYQVKHT